MLFILPLFVCFFFLFFSHFDTFLAASELSQSNRNYLPDKLDLLKKCFIVYLARREWWLISLNIVLELQLWLLSILRESFFYIVKRRTIILFIVALRLLNLNNHWSNSGIGRGDLNLLHVINSSYYSRSIIFPSTEEHQYCIVLNFSMKSLLTWIIW